MLQAFSDAWKGCTIILWYTESDQIDLTDGNANDAYLFVFSDIHVLRVIIEGACSALAKP